MIYNAIQYVSVTNFFGFIELWHHCYFFQIETNCKLLYFCNKNTKSWLHSHSTQTFWVFNIRIITLHMKIQKS